MSDLAETIDVERDGLRDMLEAVGEHPSVVEPIHLDGSPGTRH
jgi:hypothetical protein